VALAWLIAKPTITAPIASATSGSQVHEIAKATRLALTAAEIAALDEASA
jgi:aryl-alcohol dehydrogenase-like predicted oxidoreductase